MRYTTDHDSSLEERNIKRAITLMKKWMLDCHCGGAFCDSFGCASLQEIIAILDNKPDRLGQVTAGDTATGRDR